MKKLYAIKYLYFWLYTLFCIGIPIILITEEYNLIGQVQKGKYNLNAMGVIVLLIIVFFSRKQIKLAVSKMKQSKTKTFLQNIGGVIPIIGIYLALHLMKPHIYNLETIAFASIFSYIISIFFLMKHTEYELKLSKDK